MAVEFALLPTEEPEIAERLSRLVWVYGDRHLRFFYATMFAIIKIAQHAQWHKKESA